MEANGFPCLYVADAIIKEELQNPSFKSLVLHSENGVKGKFLTVLLGSMLAILSADSNAFGDGLQRIGVAGRGGGVSLSMSLSMSMSPVELFESDSEPSLEELRVSKHMILSKQPSKPSLFRTLAT